MVKLIKYITIFLIFISFNHSNQKLSKSSNLKIKSFNTLFDSSNKTIDTSPPSPIFPANPSDLIEETFTNRYHQKFIKVKDSETKGLIPRIFYAEAEVTQAQFEAVMGFNPSKFKNLDFPVTNVSFNDVSEYASKISTSKEQYQIFDRETWLKALLVNQNTRFHFGNDPTLLEYYAWTGTNSFAGAHIIRNLRPNSIGLYDMHGNIAELVSYETKAEVINCSYLSAFGECGSNYYYDVRNDYKADDVGFRLMLTLFHDTGAPPDQVNAKPITSILPGEYINPFLMEITSNIVPYQLVYTVDGSPALPENGLFCTSLAPCIVAIAKNKTIKARLCKMSDAYDCPYDQYQFDFKVSGPLAQPIFSSTVLNSSNDLAWQQNIIDISFENKPLDTAEYKIEAYLEIQGFANSPYLVRDGQIQLEKRNRPFCKYEEFDQFREIRTRRSAFLYYTMKPHTISILDNSSLRKNIYAGLFKKFYVYTKGIGGYKSCTLQNIGKTIDFNDETSLEVE